MSNDASDKFSDICGMSKVDVHEKHIEQLLELTVINSKYQGLI